jgi:signal transduction histidine kinase
MKNTDSFESGNRSWLQIASGRFARRLVPLIYVVSGLAFISDMERDNTLAYGIIYTPLVATAVFHKRRQGVWLLTGGTCLMVVIGAFFPALGSDDLPDLVGNRVLSVMAILATGAFVYHARETQERLAAQTRRAAAAERIKTEVLTDLSQEIRTPLRTLLGVLTLTMATTRPDQREALGRVRSDGRQLLATIDNLIDLSQSEDRSLQCQAVDLATIARDAAETVGTLARERQISVALTGDADGRQTTAIGDSWAVRRILDNFLANALRLTPPGGAVSINVRRCDHTVTASVSDTGRGLPPEMTEEFHENAPFTSGSALPATGGAGLALSSRLARTMNGRVTASNQPGPGATVSLSLPAA